MSTVFSSFEAGFAGFNLSPSLQRGIVAAGFDRPRPIQNETIPVALRGRDVLGLAETGSGKTAAYALPILQRILATGGEGPRALILAPTRELAAQIAVEIRLLARFTRLRVTTLFGGVPSRPQIADLRKYPEVIVACPGRLLDLHQQGEARLDRIEILVLDEADHMCDMGFLPDLRRIISALSSKRQNLLFSATMPEEIRRFADRLLVDPYVVDLNHSKPVSTVSHEIYSTDNARKLGLLKHILVEDGLLSAIVFTRTKHRARRLAQQLDRSGHQVVALQGDMSQSRRLQAMEGFRKRQFKILVATDIAARGIDVEQVSHVVNFDMPATPDAYTHRIGRTGRAGREGKAISFMMSEDQMLVGAIEHRIGKPIHRKSAETHSTVSQPAASTHQSPGWPAERKSTQFWSKRGRNRRGPRLRQAS